LHAGSCCNIIGESGSIVGESIVVGQSIANSARNIIISNRIALAGAEDDMTEALLGAGVGALIWPRRAMLALLLLFSMSVGRLSFMLLF